ncbi:hypothetical protein FRC11_008956 [Ceratobasidium sp. 423]|nr:hypothetical protein FRC11_008956 [Ceratobasidium sp. 423]
MPITNDTQPATDPALVYGAPDDPQHIASETEDSHARFFNFHASPPPKHVQYAPGILENLRAEQAGNGCLGTRRSGR